MLQEPTIETPDRNEATSASSAIDRLSTHCVPTISATAIYIPDIITPAEEGYLLSKVHSAPKPKWTILRNRRLQQWGAAPSK
ncbi:Alpha-ketoglutarate-dependent dioxygenase alkB 6, partial [Rhizophlyctis rosea]